MIFHSSQSWADIFLSKFIFILQISNLQVDRCPSKENLFGLPTLLMNAMYIAYILRIFPMVIYKCTE